MALANRAAVWAGLIALTLGGCETSKKKPGGNKSGPTVVQPAAGGAAESSPGEIVNPPGKQPKIVFEQTEYDAGKVSDDDKISHVYTFKNHGDGTLVIEKVGKT